MNLRRFWLRPGRKGSASRFRSDRGAVAVEFALLLPVLMVIMLGIIEFGLASNAQITITNAAREGARTMAIKNSTVAAIASVKAAAPNASVTILSSQISITPAVCTAGQVTKVQVTYPYKFLTGFFGTGYTMTGMAAMRCGG